MDLLHQAFVLGYRPFTTVRHTIPELCHLHPTFAEPAPVTN
jgi:hypothetical protein